MTAAVQSSIPLPSVPRFNTAADWLKALGGVPLERIIFDPPPGSATEADLLRLVERDRRLCELIDGTLVEKPVGFIEAMIAMRLGAKLLAWCDDHDLGIVSGADSTLRMASTGRIRLPDVCFFSRDRLPNGLAPKEPVPTLAPDLAVAVLSESNTTAEIRQKLTEYFDSGTRLAWIIAPPTRTVAVHHAAGMATRLVTENEQLQGEQVVPGFTLKVSDLFRNLPA